MSEMLFFSGIAEEEISELPVACDRRTKKNPKGYKMSWSGYKLHLDTSEIGLPNTANAHSQGLFILQEAHAIIFFTVRREGTIPAERRLSADGFMLCVAGSVTGNV